MNIQDYINFKKRIIMNGLDWKIQIEDDDIPKSEEEKLKDQELSRLEAKFNDSALQIKRYALNLVYVNSLSERVFDSQGVENCAIELISCVSGLANVILKCEREEWKIEFSNKDFKDAFLRVVNKFAEGDKNIDKIITEANNLYEIAKNGKLAFALVNKESDAVSKIMGNN